MKFLDLCLSGTIPVFILVHLLVAPYTKVEESFNIQATHDLLVYGTPTSNLRTFFSTHYDHFSFPGAVPRTFIGPVLLAGLSQPFIILAGFEHAQLIVRALLGLFNAASLLFFKSQLQQAYGLLTARWYILLQASQFHIIFYASRTLPNMFAFGLTTISFGLLLPHPNPRRANARHRLAISLLVFATVIFRSELALLLAAVAFHLLMAPLAPLGRLVRTVLAASAAALLISVPLDSYFWQRPLWPELWAFHYNAVRGASSAWGTSPWHHYATSALPRLLLNPLAAPLAALALRRPATSRAARALVLPPALFVAAYSLQPHKEARFVFYAVPPLTAAAALAAAGVWRRRRRGGAPYAALSLLLAASVLASLALSAGMLALSALNYPGGEALDQLRRLIEASPRDTAAAAAADVVVPVHADVLSCMTGVTLFGAHGPVSLAVDKTEDAAALADPAFWTRFAYVLAEDPRRVRGWAGDWREVGLVQGYAGIEMLRPGERAAGEGDGAEKGEGAQDRGRGRGRGRDQGRVVLGRGALVAAVRERVRGLTGGWWVGPRMEPRVHILKRVGETGL